MSDRSCPKMTAEKNAAKICRAAKNREGDRCAFLSCIPVLPLSGSMELWLFTALGKRKNCFWFLEKKTK